MSRKARTHYAILGLLCWQPMSGYDIKKMVEVALSHFWSESYGQIFPVLNRFVEEGLATRGLDRQSGGRRRQVYRVTAAGRRAYRAWLGEPTGLPRLRDELKLKFFLTSRGDASESLRLLEDYGAQQRAYLSMLRESEILLQTSLHRHTVPEEMKDLGKVLQWGDAGAPPKDSNELLIFYLTLRSGILVTEARLAWVEEALGTIRGHVMEGHPGPPAAGGST